MWQNLVFNEAHMQRMLDVLSRDETNTQDVERVSLFYILTANDDLYGKINAIYNFNERCIEPFVLQELDFCSSSKALTLLSFNLFNFFHVEQTVTDVFSNLDSRNKQIALNAIRVRFSF